MADQNVRGKDEIAAQKIEEKKKKKKRDGFWGNIRVIAEALLIAGFIQTVFFQPFYIPSGSMKPNLLIGDYVVINKMSYGYSKFSCPFHLCPSWGGRIFGSEPERGDVVVFANPGEPNHERAFVKRLVGLPGDRIKMQNSVLFINGEPAPQAELPDFAEPLTDYKHEPFCKSQNEEFCFNAQYEETLPNGVRHSILNFGDNGPYDNTDEWVIPEGQYMMIGDNRDNSDDSRGHVGLVPYENLIGQAKYVIFSSSGSSLFKIWDWRSGRYFQRIE